MYKNDIKEKISPERFDLYEYQHIILQKEWTINASVLLLRASIAAYSFVAKLDYTAKATLLIAKKPNTNYFG